MNLWVVNAGSSSLKLQCLDMRDERVLLKALVDRMGSPAARLRLTVGETVLDEMLSDTSLPDCLARIGQIGLSCGVPAPDICVHRVVHGGETFITPTLLDDRVLPALAKLVPLAPLHMPGNLAGMDACLARFPEIPQIAVFDTAFHATIPAEAYRYAIPPEWHALGIRRYGFHGSSHQYVMEQWADWQQRDAATANLVSVHLGNGSSLCAIRDGRSIDTSMGLTPLEGLVMGTRCGDIDPGIPGTVARLAGLSTAEIDHALWHDSGLKGLSGSSDMRDILARAAAGDGRAKLAHDVFCHSLRRHLGAMLAVAGDPEVIILTGGIGENSPETRQQALGGLQAMGVRLCPQRNAVSGQQRRLISRDDSPIAVAVIPTNEELQMARLAIRSVQGPT